MSVSKVSSLKVILVILIIWLISACGENEPVATATATTLNSPVPTITMTFIPPTATSIPLAATVNGEGITVEEYEAELKRYLAAQGNVSSVDRPDANTIVLEDLIIQILLAQGADNIGYVLNEEDLQSRMDELIAAAGGEVPFQNWLLENGYSQQIFRNILERSIKGAWMRDQILAGVPRSAEQVHVRQILLYNSDQASVVLAELESGRDFATLAANYEPVAQGDLGWFPRNFLPHPTIEEAAFTLQPGDFSQVIETSVGFHIIQVLEKDPNYPLNPEARLIWQEKALREWVAMQREQGNIIIVTLQ